VIILALAVIGIAGVVFYAFVPNHRLPRPAEAGNG
jgi:hypothetical protein